MLPFPSHAATRAGLNVVLLLAAVVALRLGEPVVVPLIIALLLAAVLAPAAAFLQRLLNIRWPLACVTVVFGLVLFNLLLTTFFSLAISRLAQQLPAADSKEEMIRVYLTFRSKVVVISPWPLDDILFPAQPQELSDIRFYQYLSDYIPSLVRSAVLHTTNWVLRWVVILFTLVFMLLEGRMLTRRIVQIFGPSEEVQTQVALVIRDMARQVRTYLVWRTIINFSLAIVMGLIYQTFHLEHAWTWAILLAVLNYIPYLGALVAGFPPVIDALFTNNPGSAVVIAILYTALIVIEGYVIVPVLMGRSMDLNATTVMIACLFWDLVWGVTGLFLAMPIMAGIKAVLYHMPEWRAWANLMSAEDTDPRLTARPTPIVPIEPTLATARSADPAEANAPSSP